MIAKWSEYFALLYAVGGLHVMRHSTENLRYLIIAEVAAWVCEHSE